MDKILKQWVGNVQTMAGKDILGIILYGSAVRGEYITAHSDLNLMLIFRQIDLALLATLGKLTRKHLRKYSPQLICWTQEELDHAWDVFPLEFEDIAENHRCLAGSDPFRKSRVDKKSLRVQLEFELRSKVVALRGAWLRLHQDRGALKEFIIKAGTSFEYLLKKATAVFKIKAESSVEVFDTIRQLKKHQARLNSEELRALYRALHTVAESVVKQINAA